MQSRVATRTGAERAPEERFFEGGCEAERGGRGGATLRHGCARDGARRSGRTERHPTHRAERSQKQRGGITKPPGSERSERRGGRSAKRDGGDRGEGLRAWRNAQRQRRERKTNASTKYKLPRPHGARGLDGRATRTSERRGAWRPEASHHYKNAPSLWRVERARGGSQRPFDSRAPTEGRREA